MKSAYSENVKRIIDFLQKGKEHKDHLYPYNNIKDYSKFEAIDVNTIKMGFYGIEKTIDFVKNFTLEPPMSMYGKSIISTVDYIFYKGDMLVLRTLNIPDINKVAKDIGPLPNDFFPSDHLCFVADFQLV
jgi:mRNA deadenylase 3'-5' endonuclease subunit Ccr4